MLLAAQSRILGSSVVNPYGLMSGKLELNTVSLDIGYRCLNYQVDVEGIDFNTMGYIYNYDDQISIFFRALSQPNDSVSGIDSLSYR